jgi:hypothetical protein
MDTKNVKKNLYRLAMLAETDAPVVSCYLNLEQGLSSAKQRLERRQRELLRMHKGETAASLKLCFKRIEAWLEEHVDARSKGAAVFVRCGGGDFLMGLQFYLPLPDVCIVDAVPNVYHLVEMKDTYHRYVILLATAEGSRILTVNYGTVSEHLWREFPEARERISKEWSREHYRSHLRDRRDRVLKEQVATLARRWMRSCGLQCWPSSHRRTKNPVTRWQRFAVACTRTGLSAWDRRRRSMPCATVRLRSLYWRRTSATSTCVRSSFAMRPRPALPSNWCAIAIC